MKNIFVANYDIHKMSGLEELKKEYNIVILTQGMVDVFSTDRLRYNIETAMVANGMNSGDYVLLSGSSVIVSIVTAVILKHTKTLNLIIYGSKDKRYHFRDDVLTIIEDKQTEIKFMEE